MDADDLAAKAELLRRLHDGPEMLVLPNAWDAASARAIEAAGFPAVATSSGAIASSLGFADSDSMPVEEAFTAVRRIADAVSVPVTADLEAGYQLEPTELVARMLEAGAVGCNLEDTDHHGGPGLVPPSRHAELVAAVKRAARERGVDIVLNARVDVFRSEAARARPDEALPEALERGRRYVDAGADCVFPIRLADEEVIGALVAGVGAPLNVLAAPPAPPLARLAELGVARVTFGSGQFRAAQTALAASLEALRTWR
jgi:2-methylisocitrate lyase-like PEP mutase family enzyme